MSGRTDSGRRLLFLAVVFALLGSALVVRLGYWQVAQRDNLVDAARRQIYARSTIPSQRGDIYDRSGTVLLAGLEGEDALSVAGFPETTSIVLLGNEGKDTLTGSENEDVLVDGADNDVVNAGSRDDAVPNNEGTDVLHASAGEDLFISNSICEGDLLDGGPDRDNANWANFGSSISIDMAAKKAGLGGAGQAPACGGNPLSTLEGIEDIEGTNLGDALIGDAGPNQLLGRKGPDSYFAAAGDDSILANSGDPDSAISCGEGFDTAQVDHPQYGDPAPSECEAVYERDPNSFRTAARPHFNV